MISASQRHPRILPQPNAKPGNRHAKDTNHLEGLLPFYQLWQLKVHAQAYSNLFLLISAVTLAGAFLALTFPSEKPTAGQGSPLHLDIGM